MTVRSYHVSGKNVSLVALQRSFFGGEGGKQTNKHIEPRIQRALLYIVVVLVFLLWPSRRGSDHRDEAQTGPLDNDNEHR